MTLTRKGFFAKAIAASAATLFVTKQPARADDGCTAPEIEGTWRFDNLAAPGGGSVSLHTFARGGVFLENLVLIAASANSRFPARTTSQGVWARIGPHLYLTTFEYFVRLPSGEVLRVNVKEEVQVSGDSMMIGNSKLTRYNLDGTFHSGVPCGVSNAIGMRLLAEAPSCP